MSTSHCVDEGVGVGLLVWGRGDRANRFKKKFECRVSGGRKYTIAKHVSIFVER
jgi:hypothetical protein